MAKIQPGIYEAKIVNYGIGQTKAGDPQAMILFEYNDQEGLRHEVTWFGTFREGKGQEITLKALLTCGFTGNDPSALAEGVQSNALDANRIVKITIEEEVNQHSGKSFMKVAWINDLSREMRSIDRTSAKIKLGALNLSAQLAMIRANNPAPKLQPKAPVQTQAKPPMPTEPAFITDEDFSFGPM